MKILTLFFVFSTAIDEMMLMLMLQNQQGVMNTYQANQLNHILPLLLVDSSRGSSENSELMIMLMMQGMGHDVNNALPFLLLGDSTGDGFDFTTFFLFSSMTQRDCSISTANQFNSLLPLMLMDKDEDRSDLMLMMMMQQFGGPGAVPMQQVMPYLMLFGNEEEDDPNSLLLMVLMSSMTGGMSSQQGFNNNFNMLLPLLLLQNDNGSDLDSDMLVLLLSMQSQAPATSMGPDKMLPLLLMDESADNQDLIVLMMMLGNKQPCEP